MGRPTQATVEKREAAQRAMIQEAVSAALGGAQEQLRADKEQMRSDLQKEILEQLAKAKAVGTAETTAAALEGVANLTKEAGTSGDKAFASMIAMSIAELTSQASGNYKKYIAPEVLESWAHARERMVKLLVECRAKGTTPRYRVTGVQYLNETRIFPQWHNVTDKKMHDTEIYWDEVPNQQMVPLSPEAEAIYTEFLNSLGEVPVQRRAPEPWIRTDKRLFKAASDDQMGRQTNPFHDPRVPGKGSQLVPKHEAILGSVAPPAEVR